MRAWISTLLAILLTTGIAAGQVVSGRSTAGSLSLAEGDTSVNVATSRTRVVSYEAEFSEPSGDNFLEPRETGRLRLILTNGGKSTLRGVVARIIPLAAPTGVSFNDSISVGDIPASATRYAIFYFSAAEDVISQILTFQIDIHDTQGVVADSRLITFLTKERQQ